jgi:hypothetical protein
MLGAPPSGQDHWAWVVAVVALAGQLSKIKIKGTRAAQARQGAG